MEEFRYVGSWGTSMLSFPLESLNHSSDRGGVDWLCSSRDLHTDVQNLKTGKPNNDTPPISEIVSAYKYVSLLFA